MATLKEIARLTDTSITTVSRVLNYDKTLSVGDEIRRKIIETAADLNYKTPRNRSTIKHTKQLRIGIVYWYDQKEEMDDPYYMQIRRGVEKLASKSQIETITLYKENNEYDFEHAGKIDGLICIGKFSDAQIKQFEKATHSIVFVDSSPKEEQHDSVVLDFNKAVKDMLMILLKEGYSKIGYIGGVEFVSKHIKLGERRELVFRDFLYQRNKLETKYIHIGSFDTESGYNLMKQALTKKDHAEVYFCANDSIAFGALRAIHEKGIKIPDDIAIVGFNDNPNSAYTYPPLSTVRVYTEFMGEQALESVVSRIDGRPVAVKKIIPTVLVKRKSF